MKQKSQAHTPTFHRSLTCPPLKTQPSEKPPGAALMSFSELQGGLAGENPTEGILPSHREAAGNRLRPLLSEDHSKPLGVYCSREAATSGREKGSGPIWTARRDINH